MRPRALTNPASAQWDGSQRLEAAVARLSFRSRALTVLVLLALFAFATAADAPDPAPGEAASCQVTPATLDFGLVLPDGIKQLSFRVANLGPTAVVVIASSNRSCFRTYSSWQTVDPGHYVTIPVTYLPAAVGQDTGTVFLGPAVGIGVPCRGRCEDAPPACTVTPDTLDFGRVIPNGASSGASWKSALVTNAGGHYLTCSPQVTGPGFSLAWTYPPFSLRPGEQEFVTVKYEPDTTGVYFGLLTFGESLCRDVVLRGRAPVYATFSPDTLDFGEVELGCPRRRTLTVRNPNPYQFQVTLCPLPEYAPVELDLQEFLVPPNGEIGIGVTYNPRNVRAMACSLLTMLPDYRTVAHLRGTPVPSTAACKLSTRELDFGPVRIGETSLRTFTVVNEDCGLLSGLVQRVSGPFGIDSGGGLFDLAQGETRRVTVRLVPSEPGSHAGVIDLGTPCGTVTCTAEAVAVVPPGTEDLLGFSFDPYTAVAARRTTQPYELVDAYLVLYRPSQPSGISGWECRVEIVGDVLGVSWTLPDGSLNVAAPPGFQVGLQQRLPWDAMLQLAHLRFIQVSPATETLLFVHPNEPSSLPGTPSYAAGHDAGLLVPMLPASGHEELAVAWVNPEQSLPVSAPAPRATCADGGVRLTWRYDPALADACRLYRSGTGGGGAVVVTETAGDGDGQVVFVDDGAGDAGAGPLRYCYALLRASEEVGRSPETAVACAAGPAATRLHDIAPNPFNPRTVVSFDLARPGPAHLGVYDAAGRLVRVLCSETLPAGRYSRAWDGRDAQGRGAPSGAYYARLATEGAVELRKMTLLR